ncbi:hypothetical protein [Pseudomonas syringae]|uniref:hypothetical protein n=11 Tax=Pseudomonas syringae TaxID=317 RepID=UPI000CD32FE9|nr:hypothetical protein [Pseudomonas syringae]MCF4987428.1 hypothetical protein [Pseudomonas syringae]MCF5202847.1 hypothetical protein [Pseudomonas syringae]MCF5209421.1 hypothetical protein [Pseudomonas syringae]MCF5212496.1 hypothetical protein [Pseudomonas syringae]MCF5271882.1 hypothetical protein [Pseudomonas syringae]
MKDAESYYLRHPDVRLYLLDFDESLEAPRYAELGREFISEFITANTTVESSALFGASRVIVERLLLWCWEVQKISVCAMDSDEFKSFLRFNSSPPSAWVGTSPRHRFVYDSDDEVYSINNKWRSFCVKPDGSTLPSRYNLKVIHSISSQFFEFLIGKKIKTHNPTKGLAPLFLEELSRDSGAISKGVRATHLNFAVLSAADLCERDPDFERALFIIAMTRYLLVPIRKLAVTKKHVPSMGCFVKKDYWYYEGNDQNASRGFKLPLEFIPYLERYCISREILLSSHNLDREPLLITKHGRSGVSQRQIRNIVKDVLVHAELMMVRSGHSKSDAAILKTATLYSLRDASIRNCLAERGIYETQQRLGSERVWSVIQRTFSFVEPFSGDADNFQGNQFSHHSEL